MPKPWFDLYQTDFSLLRQVREKQLAAQNPDAEEHSCESKEEEEEKEDAKISVLSLPPEVLSSVCSRLEAEGLSFLAQASKGFLQYAYDPVHWRRIAQKTWPHEPMHILEKQLYVYKSWRKLCTLRPRLRTNAIYVTRHQFTKTTCRVAASEPLAPVFLVTYYRFLRFYPDGTVVNLTTPESPDVSYRRVRRTWTPGWNDRDKAHPNIGRYQFNEDSDMVIVSLPMVQPRFPAMRTGMMYMHFRLSHTTPGACDRLFLFEHYAIMDHEGGDLVSYPSNSYVRNPFRLISIWGFRDKVYREFPRDDDRDLAQWYEMKRASRLKKKP